MRNASRGVGLAALAAVAVTPWSVSLGGVAAPSASVTKVQLQVIHVALPEPPTTVQTLNVHQRVRIAANATFAGRTVKAPLRLEWLVTRGANPVFARVRRLVVTTNGRAQRQFTMEYAPCASGKYQATVAPRLRGIDGRRGTTSFRVMNKPGSVGMTLYVPADGAVTLVSAGRKHSLRYAPGTPTVEAKPGREFLTTRWDIANPGKKVVDVVVPRLAVSGEKGEFIGGVPYNSHLNPGQSESVNFAFVIDAHSQQTSVAYPNGGTGCGRNLIWKA